MKQDDDKAADIGGNAREVLKGFIERIMQRMEEKAQAAAAIKKEYEHAVASGFDKKALKQLIKEIEADKDHTIEHRSVVETYRRALSGLMGTPLGDWARSWVSTASRHKVQEAYQEYREWADDLEARFQKAKPKEEGEGEAGETA